MNKSDLIDEIAKHADITKVKAGECLDAVLAAITSSLKKGESVTLIGFGTFSASDRAERIGRNPRTGEQIKIPRTKVAKFKAGKTLSEIVAGKANKSAKPAKAKVNTKTKK